MPSKTERQHRAMAAAAGGNSNLGIPKSVGQDFMSADKGKSMNSHMMPNGTMMPNSKMVGSKDEKKKRKMREGRSVLRSYRM